jgi:hypothetical protein
MTAKQIANIIEHEVPVTKHSFEILLNTDEKVIGIFVMADDYEVLKQKNIWRIVKNPDIGTWNDKRDLTLAEPVNGGLIVSITPSKGPHGI